MEFNKRKFNIVIIFTVCLIFVVTIFSAIDFSGIDTNSEITPPSAESDDPGNTNDPEPEEPTESPGLKEVKLGTNPWTILNYAFNTLKTNDYKMASTQNVNAVAPMGITVPQRVDKYVYKVNGIYYVKITASSSHTFGENYTEWGCVNETSVILKKNNSSNSIYKLSDYVSNFGVAPNELSYLINQSTAQVRLETSSLIASSKYYELTITAKNPNFYALLEKNILALRGPGSNPKVNSVSLTIKVEKKRGILQSIKINEKYEVSQGSARASCSSTNIITFSYGNFANSSEVSQIRSTLGV